MSAWCELMRMLALLFFVACNLLSFRYGSCVSDFGSSARASQPFPCVITPTGCFSLSRSGSVVELSLELVSSDAAPP